jgi:hypothetical protein
VVNQCSGPKGPLHFIPEASLATPFLDFVFPLDLPLILFSQKHISVNAEGPSGLFFYL